MASFFKDMFKKNAEEFLADIAEGDWSPVPPAELKLARVAPPPPPPPFLNSWVQVLRRFGEHLTDEELLIVRQQLAS